MRLKESVSKACVSSAPAALLTLLLAACGEANEAGADGTTPGSSATTPGLGSAAPGPATTIDENGMAVPVPLGTDGAPMPGVSVPPGSVDPTMPVPPGVDPTPDDSTDNPTPAVVPGAELDCSAVDPGAAPLRRLTRFEYNNTVGDLLGDLTEPGNALPPELLGNGYGNDGDEQPVSSFLAEQYAIIAEDIVARLDLAAKFPCVADPASGEDACARSIVESFGKDAYRHELATSEIDELLALYAELRPNGTFSEAIQSLLVAILQSPDFLYRFEWGVPDAANPALRRPSGAEMASRLSYFFWGTQPDPTLAAAALTGELETNEGIRQHAARLLDAPEARPVIRYFFDHFLPLNTVAELARDPAQYPTFNNEIGALMREETQGFLDHVIFQGEGTWTAALTGNYVFVNETLANFYGIPNVTGPEFRMVDVDPATTKRMGLLTQGAILAGTTITNYTNPVRRGGFVIRELMCQDIQLPTDPEVLSEVKPPEPFIEGQSSEVGRETARMRYEAHRELDSVCITCHFVLDPPGFALENFDAVGLWRDQENGVTIDATGDISVLGGAFDGPFELAQNLSETEQIYSCFASNWGEFAYGRKVDMASTTDACLVQDLNAQFAASGYNIKELLVALTQTDAFLYLPAAEVTQ